MAYNQNGQAYPGQYPPYYNLPESQNNYSAYLPSGSSRHPESLRRPSSFETGDDRPAYNERLDPPGGNHRPGAHIRMPNQEQYMPSIAPNLRANIDNSAAGGYQYHASPVSAGQAPHVAYNPQQYARTEPQYAASSYVSPSASGAPSMSYQPYNPAAYQATSPQQQSPYTFSSYDTAGTSYPTASPYQSQSQNQFLTPQQTHEPFENATFQTTSPHRGHPPGLPPRPNAYLPNSQGNSPNSAFSTAYTPPAPPPPPFSPNTEAPYHRPPPVRSSTHGHTPPQPHAPIRTGSGTVGAHHRLPALPNYQGSGDYSTASANAGSSTSPTLTSRLTSSTPHISQPPQHSPQRTNTTGRHPQSRPLPGPPQSLNDTRSANRANGTPENLGYNDIMKEVEAAVMGGVSSAAGRGHSPRVDRISHQDRINEEEEPPPLFSGSSRTQLSPQIHTNGVSTTGAGIDVNYDAYSDDSDAEAAAGLAAMQMAEEQEAADIARRSTGVGSTHGRSPIPYNRLPLAPQDPGASSDSDVPVDMDTYGGGFPDHLTYPYGNQSSQSHLDAHDDLQRQSSSATSLHRSDVSSEMLTMPSADYSLAGEDAIHPFPAFGARTDTGGTGGLSEPSANPRRLSFEDGDEATLVDHNDYNDSSSAPSTGRNSVRSNASYHTRSLSRPLPQIPGASGSDYYRARRQTDQYGRPAYPQAPEEYEQNYAAGTSAVQKANSIGSHSHTPLVVPPGRSITDAEQRRRQLTTLRTSVSYEPSPTSDTTGGTSSKLVEDIILPTIPAGRRRKFVPAKLSTTEFKRCAEPWAQSSVLAWIMEMTEGETDLKEQAIVDGIVALFTHKVPTMNTADAEALSAQLVEQMLQQGALLKDEEWVKFGPTTMTGVMFQLTGTGCYSPRVHTSTVPGRCYAHHCMRTLKKINLQTHALAPQRKAEDWVTFYKVKKENLENVPRKDIERQNNLHEIVTSEDYYMDQLNVLRVLYRDGLANSPQPIISPKRLAGFLRDVFGKVDPIKQANEDYLLAQLKYRQEEQGPWIKGFSDIFREWIRKAKTAYIEYAASFPNATLLVRNEAEKNVIFRQFLDQMRENERSRRLGWDTYLKAPITRLQRYGLLLQTVHKNMVGDSEEKNNLSTAIEEIKVVTLECDARVAEMSKRTDLAELQNKLKLRPGMEKVQLNLNHLGREIVFRGDLQRRGNNKVNWLDTHAILFDHYMVLAKPIQQRDAAGGLKHEAYDVSKLPIPMDLLVLESTNDDAVVKSSVKGISTVPTNANRNQSSQDGRLGKVTSNNSSGTAGPGTLTHTNTGTSIMSNGSGKTLVTTTVLDSSNDRVLYPFKIKHLGKTEVYVLYAPTAQNRQDWCDKIIEAKTRHATSLFAQNAEPFRIRVMADTAFGYDSQSGGPRGIVIKGTPLDRAVEECEKSFYGTGPRPGPVCRAQVNCATSFNQSFGKRMIAVGTDFGVFVSEYDNARGWTRAIQANCVMQIAVLEDFSLVLIISNKSLIAYHLETVCPAAGTNASSDSSRRAPQKLSGNRDVGFFTTGRMKDRTLVFYKKREGLSSTFKVLEPVYQKSTTSTRSRFGIKKGTTEFFRDFDDFYIPSETYAINLFTTSLAVSTNRGVEVLTLDKKVSTTIPDLKTPEVASIAARIADQRPLGMFRLSDNEFLLVYEEVGIYVDKHGDVSRAVVMEFVGRAKQACLYGSMYLVLVDVGSGFVEVRNAVNGRLRQVVSGRDVKLLDDGGPGGAVKICMQHPENERNQIVVELIVNEGLKE